VKELSYHQLLEDALDLPERADVDDLEYEIDGEEPQLQMMQVPGEAPIEIFNFSGAKKFPWKSYLLNSYLVTGVIAAMVTVIIIVVAALQAGQKPTANADTVATGIQAAADQLTQARYAFAEAATRTDLNPNYAANPGALQKAILRAASEFKQNVDAQQSDKNSPWYQVHASIITQNAVVNALKLVNSAASGQAAIIISEDPATGKKKYQKLSLGETQAIGIAKLLVIQAAQQPTMQSPDLTENALNIMGTQKVIKDSTSQLLRSQGMEPVAQQIDNQDLFGRTVFPPSQVAPSVSPNPNKVSFNHVEPQGLTMP